MTNDVLPPVYSSCMSDLEEDTSYEATMPHFFGVGSHCGSEEMVMQLAYLDPGVATRAHYHLRSDGAGYVTEGSALLQTWDQDYKLTETRLNEGDFIFFPRGMIHKFINDQSDRRFGLLGTYNGVGTPEATIKVYTEPPL